MRLKITVCPTCDSDQIRLVRRAWQGVYLGQPFTVPEVEFYECPRCGEGLFDHEALETIKAHRPPRPQQVPARRTA